MKSVKYWECTPKVLNEWYVEGLRYRTRGNYDSDYREWDPYRWDIIAFETKEEAEAFIKDMPVPEWAKEKGISPEIKEIPRYVLTAEDKAIKSAAEEGYFHLSAIEYTMLKEYEDYTFTTIERIEKRLKKLAECQKEIEKALEDAENAFRIWRKLYRKGKNLPEDWECETTWVSRTIQDKFESGEWFDNNQEV